MLGVEGCRLSGNLRLVCESHRRPDRIANEVFRGLGLCGRGAIDQVLHAGQRGRIDGPIELGLRGVDVPHITATAIMNIMNTMSNAENTMTFPRRRV